MSNLRYKYERLFAKATHSSFDYERGTIYVFKKYCRACGEGLTRPNMWDPREEKALWKKSFCCDECKQNGVRDLPTIKIKPSDSQYRDNYPLEEMAFVALEIQKEEEKIPPLLRLIAKADQGFNLLSEKLRFLEVETSDKWYPSKFFYWLGKIA